MNQQESTSHQEARERLFRRHGGGRGLSSSPMKNNRDTANEAASIQKSLNRTEALLKQELARVSHISHSIDDDGKLLESTMNDQKTMDIQKAKQSLTNLQRAQEREQTILRMSIIFFWTVVFYIMWSRIISHLPFIEHLTVMLRFQVLELLSSLR